MLDEKKYNLDLFEKGGTALNIVKFICVAVMIFVHAHMALVTESYAITDTSGFFYKVTSDFMFMGLFLFTLPIIAGFILRMDLDGYIFDGKLKNYNFKKIINIAIFLSAAGFFMNMITMGRGYTFSWNVLQLVGLSFMVIVALIKAFSMRTVFLLGVITLFAAEPLRNFLGRFDYFYPVGILIGGNQSFMLWPFFPWFSVVAFGFLLAHYYLKYNNSAGFKISSLGIGMVFLAVAILRDEISPYLDPSYVLGPSLLQPKISLILASMGLFCILLITANILFNKVHLKKYGIINSYSKGILWIYVIQMAVSYKLSFVIKRFFPMDIPSLAYLILPVSMLLLGWLVGALSIKLLQEKLIVIKLKKLDEKK